MNHSLILKTEEAPTYCSVSAQGEHSQSEARPNPLTHIDALTATKSLGVAQDVRKVLGIRIVVVISLCSCYSLGIMKAARRFEESAIV